MEADLCPCGQTDRQTDMTKLKVAFINFANAPENVPFKLNEKKNHYVSGMPLDTLHLLLEFMMFGCKYTVTCNRIKTSSKT